MLQPLVAQWWPTLLEDVEGAGGSIPGFVKRAIERFLVCGVPEAGFVRLRCPDCHTERALAFSCNGRGLCPSCGARRMHDLTEHLVERVLPDVPIRQYVLSPPSELFGLLAAREDALAALSRIFVEAVFTGIRARLAAGKDELQCGAVLAIQRFTRTLSTYPHLHLLVLDGGYTAAGDEAPVFHDDRGPSAGALIDLADEVEARFSAWLARHGYLGDEAEEPSDDGWWLSAAREPSGLLREVNRRAGTRFEVNAAVRVAAGDRKGREQLVRSVARPPLAEDQVEVLDEERVRLTLRSPTRGGQREQVLHPLVLIRRLAWLVPPPRHHPVRAFGVLAPAARLGPRVVPAGRVAIQGAWFVTRGFVPAEPVPHRACWSKLLARTHDVTGNACPRCPGTLRPRGVVLPPEAAEWVKTSKLLPLESTGPPVEQLVLPFTG